MDNNICNICGANYISKNGKWVCPACDNIRLEEKTNEEVVLLVNASTALRLANFQDAEELYSDCVTKYPKNCEGYWGRMLARYGIKYEDDLGGKKVPTVYATSIESVLKDADYIKALYYANADTKKYYEREAAKFEEIRVEWLEKASKQPSFDIFICFKDSDTENGIARTDDSYEAQELYQHLKDQGYAVFFSRESLRDKVAERYEPYIFNALNSARVMIVYSSKKEYIESTWVKNEWLRFQKKIKNGEKEENSLILAFDNMTPSEFPKCFSAVQCMNASKKTFFGDLDKHVSKVIKKATTPSYMSQEGLALQQPNFEQHVNKASQNRTAPVLANQTSYVDKVERRASVEDPQTKAAFIFLKKGLYSDSDASFKAIIDKNPRRAEALWGDIICRLKISEDNDPTIVVDGKAIYSDVNYAISCSEEKLDIGYVDKLIESIILDIDKTNKTKFVKSVAVFDNLINFTNKTRSSKYLDYLYEIAKACQNKRLFKRAQAYYAIIISLQKNTSKAYWGVLQSKLNSRNDEDLIKQPVIITTLSEFNNAIANAENDEVVNKYIDTRAKQVAYLNDHTIKQPTIISNNKGNVSSAKDDIVEKKKNKRIAIFVLCFIAAVVIVAIIVGSVEANNLKNCLSYSLTEDGNGYVVTGKKYGKADKVVIPSEYDGKPVVNIAEKAFENDRAINSVTIPKTVINIGDSAFSGCTYLDSVTIDVGVKHIGVSAFESCRSLESAIIPSSVTTISNDAFFACDHISNLVIANGVSSIGRSAFFSCDSLVDLFIPASITKIEARAFGGCDRLVSISVDKSSTTYSSDGNCLIEKKKRAVVAGCNTSVIPSGVKIISERAFVYCNKLVSVVIPASVEYVSSSAFVGCSMLESITVDEMNENYRSQDNCVINKKDKSVVAGCKNSVIPFGVVAIESEAFASHYNLTNITIPNSVTSIGNFAFIFCSGLTSIDIPNSVTSIGSYAFDGCSGITSITIPDSVTSVGSFVFDGWAANQTIHIKGRKSAPNTWDKYWKNNCTATICWDCQHSS